MSATADKARYFLEQSVPELKELGRRKLFTPQEITSIAKRRSDFEHKINARGSTAADYAQYAEFEVNVDQLRKKRVKRLGVKSTIYNGQRRVFFVFDRGMRKFPGDLKLWMQAIEYARSQQARKKVTQILTNALRLRPAKAELWIYAAQFALDENGDMTEARGYMQRGLRFCKNSNRLWLQDFRLELMWIAKIHARRHILGIQKSAAEEVVKIAGDEDDDMLMLPKVTAQDIAADAEGMDKVDVTALETLESTPIMTGAIPIAIFDAAMKEIPSDAAFVFSFYEEACLFDDMPAVAGIREHIAACLQTNFTHSWQACAVEVLAAISNIRTDHHEFPGALRDALSSMSKGLAETRHQAAFTEWCQSWIARLLQGDLDPALSMVLESTLQTLQQ